MRAVKLVSPGSLKLVDVAIPEPGPGEVRVKVAGAGLCHSDLHVLEMGEAWPYYGGTVGHEGAGYIDAIGPEVTSLSDGLAVVVNLIWGCGHCRPCVEGRDNACQVTGSRTHIPTTPGLGPDGAMAEYMLAPARQVEPIGRLDPVSAAPLTDAAVTPMHAINSARGRLTPGATVVLVGMGGLGHLGLQIIKATTEARVIALDTDEAKRTLARGLGADVVLPGDNTAATRILDETDSYGADVVFDFVGAQSTVDLAAQVIAPEGLIRLIGLGGGRIPFTASADSVSLPWGVNLQRSYGGTREDLRKVLTLARHGKLHVETVRYPLTGFQQAFDDLSAGRIVGRAVLVP